MLIFRETFLRHFLIHFFETLFETFFWDTFWDIFWDIFNFSLKCFQSGCKCGGGRFSWLRTFCSLTSCTPLQPSVAVSKMLNLNYFHGTQCPWCPSYGSRCLSACNKETMFWNFTDVTLADQATNSIPTDNANMAIHGNVTQPGGQLWNQCNWRHLINKF